MKLNASIVKVQKTFHLYNEKKNLSNLVIDLCQKRMYNNSTILDMEVMYENSSYL